jgi:hypothetical protein
MSCSNCKIETKILNIMIVHGIDDKDLLDCLDNLKCKCADQFDKMCVECKIKQKVYAINTIDDKALDNACDYFECECVLCDGCDEANCEDGGSCSNPTLEKDTKKVIKLKKEILQLKRDNKEKKKALRQ